MYGAGKYKISTDSIVLIALYTIQTAALITCVCCRYFTYKDVGLYSLQVRRPRVYLTKTALHIIIALCLIPSLVAYGSHTEATNYRIIKLTMTCTQITCWFFSGAILRFEYRRALGHIWYMHPLFIWLSVVIYAADFLWF